VHGGKHPYTCDVRNEAISEESDVKIHDTYRVFEGPVS
jgi:hypothetical protein